MKKASSDQGGGNAKVPSLFANAAFHRPDPDEEPYKSLGAGTEQIFEPEESFTEMLIDFKFLSIEYNRKI
jgi:hypothetical protein